MFTRWIKRHNTKILAVALLIGIALQDLAAVMHPAVLVLAVASMLLACLRMQPPDLRAIVGRPVLLAACLLWILLAAPVLVFASASLVLEPGSSLLSGLTLNAAAPSLLSAPAYALIVGVNPMLATVVSVLTTLAAPFSVPAVADLLLGARLSVDSLTLLLRLLLIVAVTLGGAWLGKRLFGQARIDRYGDHIDALIILCIAGFGIGLMHGVRDVLVDDPGYVLLVIVLAFALNIILQAAAVLLFWRWGRVTSTTVALVSGNRNMAVILAVIIDFASPELILYVVCAQFPMFSLPLVMRPMFARLQRHSGATADLEKKDRLESSR